MRVFISFATEDRAKAEAVYDDVAAANAEVFQYGRSESAGQPTWEEIVAWIKKSDAFVLLVSRHSVGSPAVREEMNVAYYAYVNSGMTKPSKIIPAIIETGAEPPALIEHFTRLQLTTLASMLPRLLKQLGLQKRMIGKAPSASPFSALPDPSELFNKYLRKNPTPSPASEWSEKAEKIVANYHRLKPAGITGSIATSHLARLLREQMDAPVKTPAAPAITKVDELFLGLSKDAASSDPPTPRTLSDLLLTYDPSAPLISRPLATPKVTASIFGLSWHAVDGAASYAVEESEEAGFSSPKVVYRGTNTLYASKVELGKAPAYYRVKAVGGVFRRDSAWSEPVRDAKNMWLLTTPVPAAPPASGGLAAPRLRVKPSLLDTELEWDTVHGAAGFVVERSDDGFAGGNVTTVYKGDRPRCTDFGSSGTLLGSPSSRVAALVRPGFATEPKEPPVYSYRVKAIGGRLQSDSEWSNVVTARAGGSTNPFAWRKH